MSNKTSILLISGKREQLQMAAMMASVGAVSGNDVTVFISMNALEYFTKNSDHNAPSEGPMGDLLVEKNAPKFMDLFTSAVELGDAEIYPCSMAIDIMELKEEDLEEFLSKPLGLTKFLDDASEGQVWTF